MVNIITHGTPIEYKPKPLRFRCVRCDCVFETDEKIVCGAPNMNKEWRGVRINTEFYSECPECGAGAEEVVMR